METFKFKNIPIHVCDKTPLYPAIFAINSDTCPFCGEKMTDYSKQEFADGKGRDRHGSPEFYKMLEEMANTHDDKSHDYASNDNPFGNYTFAGMLSKLFDNPDDSGFIARIGEKLYRLANLENSGKIPKNESVRDTERDICVITTLWMAQRREKRKRLGRDRVEKELDKPTYRSGSNQAQSLFCNGCKLPITNVSTDTVYRYTDKTIWHTSCFNAWING